MEHVIRKHFGLGENTTHVDAKTFASWLISQAMTWRQTKPDDQWPWRDAINSGKASIGYLQGIILENYHYVRAAGWRQAAALASDMPEQSYEAFRTFVTEEAPHDALMRTSLELWGMSPDTITNAIPLTGTRLFIDCQRSTALAGVLIYSAGTTITELHPSVFKRMGGPYDRWVELYQIPPNVLAPLNSHLKEDVDGDHGGLLQRVLEPYGSISLGTAARLLLTARHVFDSMRIWQSEMYRHYQLAGSGPLSAADIPLTES